MLTAKDIVLKPIDSKTAHSFVLRVHYSKRVIDNANIHIGVFLEGVLHGVMQFGSPLDKRKVLGLVRGTQWGEMIELNRMAFDEYLPRNSESRAISIAMRIIKKHAPQLKWVLSFSDATLCGDGAIYRASGFVLTGIRKNTSIWITPNGETVSRVTLTQGNHVKGTVGASMKKYREMGYKPLEGFQLRYIYFLDPSQKDHLTVPILPFSTIDEMGARMYKGVKRADNQGDSTMSNSVGRFDSDLSANDPL